MCRTFSGVMLFGSLDCSSDWPETKSLASTVPGGGVCPYGTRTVVPLFGPLVYIQSVPLWLPEEPLGNGVKLSGTSSPSLRATKRVVEPPPRGYLVVA